jgi:subtilisin family serine protease
MLRRRLPGVLALGAAALALAPAGGGIAHPTPPAGAGSSLEALALRARREGSVRVLVATLAPETTSGMPTTGAGLAALSAESARRRGFAAAARRLLDEVGGRAAASAHVFRTVPLVAMEADEVALRRLAGSGLARRLWEDALLHPALADTVPVVGAPAAWSAGYRGAGRAIAILDTGVDASHPFLGGRVVEEACFSTTWPVARFLKLRSACPGRRREAFGPGAAAPCRDAAACWHGTHVAGIAAGEGDGISGVAPEASIIAVQVFSLLHDRKACAPLGAPCAVALVSDVARGLEHVYELRDRHEIAAANMSFAAPSPYENCHDSPLRPLVENLRWAGIAPVVAGGNEPVEELPYPACIPSAVGVGATTKSDEPEPTSNRSPWLSLRAPGTDVVSSVPGGGFAPATGTSMAAPHVSGAWALLKDHLVRPSVDNVLYTLQISGQPVAVDGSYRARRLNLDRALDMDATRFDDGGFEAPAPGAWRELSPSGRPLVLGSGDPGLPVEPRSGGRLACLGGDPFTRDQIRQTIFFPPGRRFSLRLHEQIRSASSDCSSASFRILSNGLELHREPICAATSATGWVERDVDLTAAMNAVELILETTADGPADPGSVFLDDLSLEETGPPDAVGAPATPRGPRVATAGLHADYEVWGSSTYWGEQVQYMILWGDGTSSGWYTPMIGAASVRVRKAWTVPGAYEVTAMARSSVFKLLHSGPSAPAVVTVRPSSGPDLAGSWEKVQQSCARAGRSVRCTLALDLDVRNQGDQASGPCDVTLFLSEDPRPGLGTTMYKLKEAALPALQPGRLRAVRHRLPLPKGVWLSGYYVVAEIDFQGAVFEADETNNQASSGILP